MKYLVIFERTPSNWGAYAPDLPGLAVTGNTKEECEECMRGAMALHIKGMREDGQPVPEPSEFTVVEAA